DRERLQEPEDVGEPEPNEPYALFLDDLQRALRGVVHARMVRPAQPAEPEPGGVHPGGGSTLKTSVSCVERETTIRTGSSSLALSSTCTTSGGTHTKSPGPASSSTSSASPQRKRALPEMT